MTRLQADALLLLTAIIWGTAFIAQKTGMNGIGPMGFVGVRFLLSFLVVLPFALRESRRRTALARADLWPGFALCVVFFLAAALQQAGLVTASVTHAGFLTGLYVVFVPFFAWVLFRQRPGRLVWPAAFLALGGVWLLNGARGFEHFVPGDWMVLGCAVFCALQVCLIGTIVQRTYRPLTFCALQYLFTGVAGCILAACFETTDITAYAENMGPLLYAGIASGGIAFTLQAVAQQYSPPSDAAIILSGEALFAALAGYLLLEERMGSAGWSGCALIFAAILMVEARSFAFKRKLARAVASKEKPG